MVPSIVALLAVVIAVGSALPVLMKMCRSTAVEIIAALIIVAAMLRQASVAIIRRISTGFLVAKSKIRSPTSFILMHF